MKGIKVWIERNEWLLVIMSFTVLLRIPSLFEPHWYGDEGIYLVIGQALNRGLKLYAQIHDNKPPLLYLMAAWSGGSLFWFKLNAMLFNLASVGIFYKLGERFFDNKKGVIIATTLFSLATTLPKLEGNIANAEIFFLTFTLGAFYFLQNKKNSFREIFVAGVLLGIGGLFKMPAMLEAGIWPLFWIIQGDRKWFAKSAALGIGVMTPIIVSLGYYFSVGIGNEYVTAAWLQNMPYISSWKESSTGSGVYSLKGRLTVLVVALVPILGFSERLGRRLTLFGIWALISLFAALLSGRPYPHYLIQSAAPLSIGAAWILTAKYNEKMAGLAFAALFASSIFLFKFYNYKALDYYKNFLQWSVGKIDTNTYFTWFSQNTVPDQTISTVIGQDTWPSDKIFVWGDDPMIYAMSQRLPVGKYTAKYHIKDFKAEQQTMEQLQNIMPKYVVSFGNEQELPGFAEWIRNNYKLDRHVGNADVYKITAGK